MFEAGRTCRVAGEQPRRRRDPRREGSEYTISLPRSIINTSIGAFWASKILIVEDEVHIRRILQLKLCGAGFEFAVAMDGASGLELAKEFHPGLIVTDYRMPGELDGVGLIKSVRGTAEIGETPIVLLSGSVSIPNDLHAHLRDFPNVTLLSKPFSPRAHLQVVITILAGD